MEVVAAVVGEEDRRNLGGNRVDGTGREMDTWSRSDWRTEGPGKEEDEDEERVELGLNRPEVGARLMYLSKGGIRGFINPGKKAEF